MARGPRSGFHGAKCKGSKTVHLNTKKTGGFITGPDKSWIPAFCGFMKCEGVLNGQQNGWGSQGPRPAPAPKQMAAKARRGPRRFSERFQEFPRRLQGPAPRKCAFQGLKGSQKVLGVSGDPRQVPERSQKRDSQKAGGFRVGPKAEEVGGSLEPGTPGPRRVPTRQWLRVGSSLC